jgi:hypothetical protein
MAILNGPMLMQRLLRWQPTIDEQGLAERVVDTVLAGIAAG